MRTERASLRIAHGEDVAAPLAGAGAGGGGGDETAAKDAVKGHHLHYRIAAGRRQIDRNNGWKYERHAGRTRR